MPSAAGILASSRKTVGESLTCVGRSSFNKRKEDNFVALLSPNSVPRSMKGDEESIPVPRRELRALIKQQPVRSPVSGERGHWKLLVGAAAGFACIATVFRG